MEAGPFRLLAAYCFGPGVGLALTAAGLATKVFFGAGDFGKDTNDGAEVISGVLTNLASDQLLRLPKDWRNADLDRAVVAAMIVALNAAENKYLGGIAPR